MRWLSSLWLYILRFLTSFRKSYRLDRFKVLLFSNGCGYRFIGGTWLDPTRGPHTGCYARRGVSSYQGSSG